MESGCACLSRALEYYVWGVGATSGRQHEKRRTRYEVEVRNEQIDFSG